MKKLFEKRFHRAPETICFAPGRVNLIGEHTDYNGGHVFPCAIHLGVCCASAKRADRELHFYSENFPEDGERIYSLNALDNQGAWSDYPTSVVRALEAFGYPLPQGADFVFNGDLPDGAGLSSSAAMEVATGVTLRELFGIPVTQQELALLGQFAENRFIGVNCGIMDQFASAMGRKKTRFCSMRTHFPINTRRSSMRLWSLSTVGCGILLLPPLITIAAANAIRRAKY